MSAVRAYVDQLISRISFDRILPWSIESGGLYGPKASKAGF
jgi:hypothetical protein